MLVTYWDLSESDRAALSADDVQKYLDAELMTKGVLKVRPLELEPVPEMPTPTTRAFVVRTKGKYGRDAVGIAFTSIEAAQQLLALRPMRIDSEYLDGTSVEYTVPIDDPEIAEVPIFCEADKDAARADLKRAAAIVAANERKRTEYTTAVRAQEKALEGLWEDWTRCRDEEAKLRQVADTFADYKRTAGDDAVAAKFLAKVYPSALINEAASRFGFYEVTVPVAAGGE